MGNYPSTSDSSASRLQAIPNGIGIRFECLPPAQLGQPAQHRLVGVSTVGNLRGVVVVHTADTYGRTLAKEFSQAVESFNSSTNGVFEIPPVTAFEIPGESVSYSDTVREVQKLNPAAQFFAAGPNESAVFLSELFGLDFQGSIFGADRSLSYNVVDQLGCQSEGSHFASVLPDPANSMSSAQIAAYAALEGQAPELESVAGYSGVEFIVRSYERTGALDAGNAAVQARETTTTTILGDVAFDANGAALSPMVHFLKVQGRLFKEVDSRVVGSASERAVDEKR